MSEKQLREFLPFTAIEDGVVLTKRGDLTFGWRVFSPTAYTVNEPGYDTIIWSLIQAYKVLPDFTILHKQDIFCNDRYVAPEADFYLQKAYFKHFEGRRFLNGYCNLYLTFSDKNNVMRTSKESGFFGTHDSKKLSEDYIRYCAGKAAEFAAVFGANPLISLVRLETDDFLSMDAHGQDQGVIADYLRFYDKEDAEHNIKFHRDHIEYGSKIVKMWYVEDSDAYPGMVSSVSAEAGLNGSAAKVFLSGGSPIGYKLRIPHVVNRYLVKMKKGIIIETDLEMRKRVMVSFSGMATENRVNAQEIQTQIDRSADNSTTLVKCFMNVMAWGNEDDIAGIGNSIVTAFRSELDMAVVEEDEKLGALYYAAIPGASSELGYDCYLTSEIVSYLCHGLWDGYDSGIRGGIVHVSDRRRRIPVVIDLQQKARNLGLTKAFNMLVCGPTGSGKSFTMNSLVQDFYLDGQHTVIIDIGDSYQGFCRLVNELSGGKDGIYNTYDPKHPFSFNPFYGRVHWDDVDAEGEKVGSGMDFLLSLIKTMYKPEGGWQNQSSAALKYLIKLFLDWWDKGAPLYLLDDLKEAFENERRRRAEKNHKKFDETKALYGFVNPIDEIFPKDRPENPLFDDFYQFITRIAGPLMRDENLKMGEIKLTSDIINLEHFGAAMDMYRKGGTYGFLLNAETHVDLFSSRLTVFEVDKIKDNEDLFPLWVLCIMHSFEDKMRSLHCHKNIIIEEAWKALDTPEMADFIRWLWRTSRKFNTSAVVVSQNISDLVVSNVVRDAIIPNTDIRILLDQRGNEDGFQRSVPILSLSPMATNLVLSVNTNKAAGDKSKEAFIQIGPNYCNVFNFEVSLKQALCFETNKDDKRELFELADRIGSFREAIDIIADRKTGRKV